MSASVSVAVEDADMSEDCDKTSSSSQGLFLVYVSSSLFWNNRAYANYVDFIIPSADRVSRETPPTHGLDPKIEKSFEETEVLFVLD